MAVGSSRKKKTKRPPSSDLSSPMAFPSSSSSSSQPLLKTSRYGNYFRKRFLFPLAIIAFFFILILYVTSKKAASIESIEPDAKFYTIDIVNEFPHDPDAFTQGLLYGGNNTLFESTGLYGRSSVRQVLLQTGKVLVNYQMDSSQFGEGLTLLGDRLFQVTWLKKTGFIYDRYDFSKWKKFTHQMQDGWGLATDGNVVFGSDGTSTLYQLDPTTWKALHKVTVRYNDREVPFLNELEYINGEVWANVWQVWKLLISKDFDVESDCIARISHNDGFVRSWILLHELRQRLFNSGYNAVDVLNGIAWDKENNRLFVTGKLWPRLYEIKLRPVTSPLNGKVEHFCSLRG